MCGFVRIHLGAALLAAVGLGIGARAVMRVIALASGLPGSFSPGGSLEVVLFGALIGFPVALGFFAVRDRVRLRAPYAGAAVGLTTFLVLMIAPPSAARSALAGTPDPAPVTALLFAVLFLLFGVGLDWRWTRWTRRLATGSE